MIAGLFDLDGVVLDTETQYDVFWEEQGRIYCPDIPAFNRVIKGQTLQRIFDEYILDVKSQREVTEKITTFEKNMPFPYISGVVEFVEALKKEGIPVAIVTSSAGEKMEYVYRKRPELKELFDVIITADRISRSKPDPEGYLLAASELNISPDACYVFEDSFSGMEAGHKARMTVVGLATTWPAERIIDKADCVIPNFLEFGYEQLLNIKKS